MHIIYGFSMKWIYNIDSILFYNMYIQLICVDNCEQFHLNIFLFVVFQRAIYIVTLLMLLQFWIVDSRTFASVFSKGFYLHRSHNTFFIYTNTYKAFSLNFFSFLFHLSFCENLSNISTLLYYRYSMRMQRRNSNKR